MSNSTRFTVLFHLGVLDAPPRIQQPNRQAACEAAWAQVPPRLAATLRDYIAQVRLSLRLGRAGRPTSPRVRGLG
jgi:hypothetical protein